MIEQGNTATVTFTTDERATAIALGSGDLPVLGTPKVAALVEEAAVAAIAGLVDDDYTTVGSHLEIDHYAPTPVGGTVVATATVVSVKGRRVDFVATVTAGEEVVARAAHVRFVVNRGSFMDSVS
ncbi:MAG: hotdog domain-containing protein [Actinomycetota bacterium]